MVAHVSSCGKRTPRARRIQDPPSPEADQKSRRRDFLNPGAPPLFDTIESPVDLIRDRIAARSQRMDARYPNAPDREAELVQVLHRELVGTATMTCGTYQAENWRAMLRGERSIPIVDLCRLITEPGREGHDAVAAVVEVLARRLGILTSERCGR